jgi:hypothetical protein
VGRRCRNVCNDGLGLGLCAPDLSNRNMGKEYFAAPGRRGVLVRDLCVQSGTERDMSNKSFEEH